MRKFIPILFSPAMVKAILLGNKTMTRRVVKPQPKLQFRADNRVEIYSRGNKGLWEVKDRLTTDGFSTLDSFKSPYGNIGDVLWVREKFCYMDASPNNYAYAADYGPEPVDWNWKPSIHMPKSACRIFLQITNIRVERLQDITEADAKSEGAEKGIMRDGPNTEKGEFHLEHNIHAYYKTGFQFIWQSINGEQSWNDNPWVWVIEFKRIEKPIEFTFSKN